MNLRSNGVHFRIYQKNENVRFELELKHRETKSIPDYFFNNPFNVFEDLLVERYLKSFQGILSFYYAYTDWILDFQRRLQFKDVVAPVLVSSYLENHILSNKENNKLFHLLQFLSFVIRLKEKDLSSKCRIKQQNYYSFEFSLTAFIEFTVSKLLTHYKRKKLILFFKQFQTLYPIIKTFSDDSLRCYVCFPYVNCKNPGKNDRVIEIFIAEELLTSAYPFNLLDSFLHSNSKNDLRLKILFIKSLAVSGRLKTLDLAKFFLNTNDSKHLTASKRIEFLHFIRKEFFNTLATKRAILTDTFLTPTSS